MNRRKAVTLGTTAILAAMTPQNIFAATKRKVVVWSEGSANVQDNSKKIYPNDINTAIAEGLKPLEEKGWEIILATLKDPGQGLTDERLNTTDVLIWWGHKFHDDVKAELAQKIAARVKDQGMGFIGTHSTHFARPFKAILGTECSWREYTEDHISADILVKLPDHPICKGVKNFKLPGIELYGEPFAVPEPESVPLDGLYTRKDGRTESGRMGLCWTRGKGRVFYFTPGHETFDDYFRPEVRRIFINAVEWAAPTR
jgi:trehalose utilization protein